MAIWRKDEKLYTALQDLMRTYLIHNHTPNIDRQLKEQFDSYFAWHEENWENSLTVTSPGTKRIGKEGRLTVSEVRQAVS